jgi:hypothetical protein
MILVNSKDGCAAYFYSMKKLVAAIAFILSFFGCSNKLYVADSDFESKYIPFIKDNAIQRDDVILQLGEPSWLFENGRIFTYRLFIDEKGRLKPINVGNEKKDSTLAYAYIYGPKQYSLVLIFNSNNLLQKHSLVRLSP